MADNGRQTRRIPEWLRRITPGAKKAEELKQKSPEAIREEERKMGRDRDRRQRRR